MSDWFSQLSGQQADDDAAAAGARATSPEVGSGPDAAALAGRPVELLAALPRPSQVYAAALANSSRAMVGGLLQSGRSGATRLPDVALRVADVALDQARLDRYRALIGDRSGTGGSGESTPPGFVHVSVFGLQLALLARPDFPLPMLGLVHVANRIEQLRTVAPGEALTATTWARELVSRPSGDRGDGVQVDLVTEVRAADELVWQGVSTYLARSARIPGLPVVERPERPAFTPPVPTSSWQTSKATSRGYAEVSGDRNPIHTSTLAARAFGFGRTIAHGMDTAARALATLGPVRGDAFTWRVEWASPVLVPSRVSLRVEARHDVDATADGTRAGWEMTAWDPRGGRLHLRSTLSHA